MEDYFSSTQGYRIQKSIRRTLRLQGVGLHSGLVSQIELRPAPPNHGIVFERVDLDTPVQVIAHYEAVVATDLATSLGLKDKPEARIGTVEHLMAAIYGLGITNLKVVIKGSEVPIFDGSASPFIDAIIDAGIEFQPFSHAVLRIVKPVKVFRDGVVCELLPRERLRLTTSVDFPHPSIGLQTFALEVTPGGFMEQVSSARTFGFIKDVERLRKNRLALGASLENVLAFSEEGILNPEGARFSDECVRHKLLDAIGDLALIGCWIEGEMVSFRGGHRMHLELLKALRAHPTHWEIDPAAPLQSPPLPVKQRRTARAASKTL